MRPFLLSIATMTCCVFSSALAANAQEPGWTGRVIKPTSQRAAIEATPILQRPYRPLHVYGNTVRRMHYRGRALPRATDVAKGAWAWVFRR